MTPLPYILDADTLLPLLREHGDVAAALLPHLPPGQQDAASLAAILRSPQLRQAAMALTAALADGSGAGNLATICTNFGLRASDGHAELVANDPVAALIACVQAQAQRDAAAASGGSSSASAPPQPPPPPPPPPGAPPS